MPGRPARVRNEDAYPAMQNRGDWPGRQQAIVCAGSAKAGRSTIKTDMAKEYIEERGGSYYIAGTRVSLDSIVHAFRRGESPETICQNFELLRLEEVYGAIAYYLANQAGIDAYLIRQNEKWREGRRNAEPLPADLRERLMRARDELHAADRS